MDQAAGLVAEEHVDLLRFDDGGDLTAAKFFVGHRLSLAVLAGPVVGRGVFAGPHIDRGFDAAGKGADRLTCFARSLGDLALFSDRLDRVVLLQIASRTHHLERVADGISRCIHIFVPDVGHAPMAGRAA